MTWFWERRNDVFLLNARTKYYYSIIRIHRYLPPFLFGLFVFHGGGGGGPDSGRCSCGTIIIAVAHTNGRTVRRRMGKGRGARTFTRKRHWIDGIEEGEPKTDNWSEGRTLARRRDGLNTTTGLTLIQCVWIYNPCNLFYSNSCCLLFYCLDNEWLSRVSEIQSTHT